MSETKNLPMRIVDYPAGRIMQEGEAVWMATYSRREPGSRPGRETWVNNDGKILYAQDSRSFKFMEFGQLITASAFSIEGETPEQTAVRIADQVKNCGLVEIGVVESASEWRYKISFNALYLRYSRRQDRTERKNIFLPKRFYQKEETEKVTLYLVLPGQSVSFGGNTYQYPALVPSTIYETDFDAKEAERIAAVRSTEGVLKKIGWVQNTPHIDYISGDTFDVKFHISDRNTEEIFYNLSLTD